MQKLGQHFLKNKSAIKKIIGALDLQSGDTVVEIGAGHGELTKVIRREACNMKQRIKIIAVEKDLRLVEQLKKNFAGDKDIEVIAGDALKIVLKLCSMFHASCFKICGNIPYYITGRLLRILSELENKPELCVLTLQKEVAERISSKPPKMNKLAAITQFWTDPKIIANILKTDFRPEPKVDSAVIKLETRNVKRETYRLENYYKTVKILFAQPRKTILNNLTSGKWLVGSDKEKTKEALKERGINPGDRPQNLSVEEIEKIANMSC